MCGVAGIFLSPGKANPEKLHCIEAMTSAMYHRGPDGSGAWVDRGAGIALGHRRLAVVDLSAEGHQPMHSHGEKLVLTFNGEIYNHSELRSEMEEHGSRFRGHSDTEAILAVFERFGIEPTLKRLVGMFALSLWDRNQRVLHLARDRVGKKPLYVAVVNGGIVFASELKAILTYPDIRAQIDPTALAMALQNGWIPEEHCVWKGMFKLPPGALLSIKTNDLMFASADRLRERVRQWWSLRRVAEWGQSNLHRLELPALETQLDTLLHEVVGQRMVADVPIGAFLSGGIDSSLLVALMQAQSTRPIRTFSIGFRGTLYDEAPQAASVAKRLRTDHTEFNVTSEEAQSVIPDLPSVWDEPFADESQIPTLLLARLARRHVTVALTGDGGDECFGGYNRHVLMSRLAPVFRLPRPLRRNVSTALSLLSAGFWDRLLESLPLPATKLHSLRYESLQKLSGVIGVSDENEFYDRLIRVGSTPIPGAAPCASVGSSPSLPEATSRMIYRDMTEYLPGDILVKTDRASMAASLEARSPLLDHRLIEFVWRLPIATKVRGGKGKWLLRQMLKRYLPEEMFDRPKHGFNVPIGDWLRGPLHGWAGDLLHSSRVRDDGLLDPAQVQQCWSEHLNRRRDRARELWAILMVQAWRESASSRLSTRQATKPAETTAAMADSSIVN